MNAHGPIRVLLGPQLPLRNIGAAVANSGIPEGPLAVISAGWQEAEGDLDELGTLVGRPLEELGLYQRVEAVMAGDPGLASAARERQDKLINLQRLYGLRLKQLAIAARSMLTAEGDADMLMAEQRHAVAQLRALDRHHLHRSELIWEQFLGAYGPHVHAQLARHASEVVEIAQRCAGVMITGGNVAVLINRLRLLGSAGMLNKCNIVAWSAGAMALTERIVLFHDKSPEGRRDAEVFGAGCGVLPGYVILPDTKNRLRTAERRRTGLLCRRFSPDLCVSLDNGTELHLDDTGVSHVSGTRRIDHDGRLVRIRAA